MPRKEMPNSVTFVLVVGTKTTNEAWECKESVRQQHYSSDANYLAVRLVYLGHTRCSYLYLSLQPCSGLLTWSESVAIGIDWFSNSQNLINSFLKIRKKFSSLTRLDNIPRLLSTKSLVIFLCLFRINLTAEVFLQARCSSCHPINSVTTLKESECTVLNQ